MCKNKISYPYSTFTFSTASTSNTAFVVLHISNAHKFNIRNKYSNQNIQVYRRRDKNMLVDKKAIGTLRLLKMTLSCFGKAKPFNMLTLYRDCHSVRYAKPVRQLVTQIGLCSHSGLAIWDETVSTCWVFAVTSIVPILISTFEWIIF